MNSFPFPVKENGQVPFMQPMGQYPMMNPSYSVPNMPNMPSHQPIPSPVGNIPGFPNTQPPLSAMVQTLPQFPLPQYPGSAGHFSGQNILATLRPPSTHGFPSLSLPELASSAATSYSKELQAPMLPTPATTLNRTYESATEIRTTPMLPLLSANERLANLNGPFSRKFDYPMFPSPTKETNLVHTE